MSLFIDSVVWIGAKLKNDQWHKRSVEIIKSFIHHDIETVYVTDYIVLETVNFILRKGGFDAAYATLNIFQNHERIKIVNVDEVTFTRAASIFKKYPGLSITDASIVAAMEERGIKNIHSFDRGFDKIDWITRLE